MILFCFLPEYFSVCFLLLMPHSYPFYHAWMPFYFQTYPNRKIYVKFKNAWKRGKHIYLFIIYMWNDIVVMFTIRGNGKMIRKTISFIMLILLSHYTRSLLWKSASLVLSKLSSSLLLLFHIIFHLATRRDYDLEIKIPFYFLSFTFSRSNPFEHSFECVY
jgi:hypothetical protein